ncbi:MAG: MBL fold metallo-hydrolase [Nitrososphaerota archaeon]
MPRLTFLGTGSIIPTSQRFSSGILLEVDDGPRILLDIGPGILEKLRRASVDPGSINIILVTHLHLDHVSDLLPFIKLRALCCRKPFRVFGPPGIARMLNLMISDRDLFGYLSDLGCHDLLDIHEIWDDMVELEPGISLRSKPVEHFNGVAYRIDLPSASITYSGDAVPDPRLVELARGTRVLIHECSFPADKLKGKHTSAEDLLRIAIEVNPEILILTHLYPEMEEELQGYIEKLGERFGGRVYAPRDLDAIEV